MAFEFQSNSLQLGIGSMEEEIENHHDPKEIESTENVSVTEIIGTLNKEIGK